MFLPNTLATNLKRHIKSFLQKCMVLQHQLLTWKQLEQPTCLSRCWKFCKMKLTEWLDFLYVLQLHVPRSHLIFAEKWIPFTKLNFLTAYIRMVSFYKTPARILLFQQNLFFSAGIDIQRERYLHSNFTSLLPRQTSNEKKRRFYA